MYRRSRSQRWCRYCQQYVLAVNEEPNCCLHTLLTVITLGLWLPVWMILIFKGNYRCQKCGTRV